VLGGVSAFPGFARCARYDLPAIFRMMTQSTILKAKNQFSNSTR
jgi:hypothetical protein